MIETINENFKKLVIDIQESKITDNARLFRDIFKIILNPGSNAKHLKDVIEQDYSLCTSVLQIANSAYYGSVKHIDSIQQAIVWIGFDSVIQLVLVNRISEFFEFNQTIDNNFSHEYLWKSSLISAILGKIIYRLQFCDSGNFMFSAGLFHNLGILFLHKFRKNQFLECLQLMKKDKIDLFRSEYTILGFDHTKLISFVFKSWGMPEELVQIIKYHHNPLLVSKELRRDASSLFLIDQLVKKNYYGYSDLKCYDEHITQTLFSFLGLNETMRQTIFKKLNEEIKSLVQMGWLPN